MTLRSTFLPDWQLALIFVRFISNFLCLCPDSMASAHVILMEIKQSQSGRKVVPRDSKSDLPLAIYIAHGVKISSFLWMHEMQAMRPSQTPHAHVQTCSAIQGVDSFAMTCLVSWKWLCLHWNMTTCVCRHVISMKRFKNDNFFPLNLQQVW